MALGINTDFTGQTVAERYDVRKRIGSGNMGHVFLAWDNRLETDIVLKVPTLARLENAEFRKRFLQESRFLVKLNHPRIVHILDVGEHDGVPFFAMQYVGGGSLESRIHPTPGESAPQPISSLADWVFGTAEALDFMHTKGYVHRDIKPGNILYDTYGNAYLSDFGLSKILGSSDQGDSSMTAAGAVVGTPNYVAPEVVLGLKYGGHADQYSFAMTIYEALTGRCPLQGPTPSATMVNQTAKLPPPPHTYNAEIPVEISEVIMRGLAKPPANRFQDCRELAHTILHLAGFGSGGHGSGRMTKESSSRSSGGGSAKTGGSSRSHARSGPQSSSNSKVRQSPPRKSSATSSLSQASRQTTESSHSADRSAEARTAASQSKQASLLNQSQSTLPQLQYRIVSSSKVRSEKAPCPKCQADLRIKTEYAGRKGKCVKCHANLLIARDLKSISYVKPTQQSTTHDDQFNLVIGTEVFGFRLKKWQALALVCSLGVSVTGAALYMLYSFRQRENDRLPVNKATESYSENQLRSQRSEGPAPAQATPTPTTPAPPEPPTPISPATSDTLVPATSPEAPTSPD